MLQKNSIYLNLNSLVLFFFIVASVVDALIFSLSYRSLYADGSFSVAGFASSFLNDENSLFQSLSWHFSVNNPRQFGYILTHLIPWFFSKCCFDLQLISIIYGLTCILVPCFFWFLSLFFLRNNSFLFLIYSILYTIFFFYIGNTYSMGTHSVAYALVACIFSLLFRKEELDLKINIVLIFLLILLLRTYEGVVYFYPLIAVASLLKFNESNQSRKYLLVIIFTLCIIGISIAVYAYFYGPYITQGSAFDFQFLKSFHLFHLGIISLILSVLFWFIFYQLHTTKYNNVFSCVNKKSAMTFTLFAMLCFSCYISAHVYSLDISNPLNGYMYRFVIGYFLFAVLFVIFCLEYAFKNKQLFLFNGEAKSIFVYLIPVVIFCSTVFLDMRISYGYLKYINLYHLTVNSGSGIKNVEDTELSKFRHLGWWWTDPTMSNILRSRQGALLITNPRSTFLPMNKHDILGHYYWGIRIQ